MNSDAGAGAIYLKVAGTGVSADDPITYDHTLTLTTTMLTTTDDLTVTGGDISFGAGSQSISESSSDMLIDAGSGGDVIIRIG